MEVERPLANVTSHQQQVWSEATHALFLSAEAYLSL